MGQQRSPAGLLADEGQLLAGQEIQPVGVVRVGGNGDGVAGLLEADNGLHQDALALLDVLSHGVQVGGQLHAGGEDALAVLALTLAVELFPPFGKEAEGGLEAAEDLDLLSGSIKAVPGGGVLGRGGAGRICQTLLALSHGAGHETADVDARHGNGQQTHGGQHGVAAAHLVGDDKGLIALPVCHAFQRAPGLVGGGVDAGPGPRLAVALLQQIFEDAEGHGGLSGGPGFGDDVHREIPVAQQVDDLLKRIGGQPVADKIDVRRGLGQQVVIGGFQKLNDGAGPQIGAADSDDDQSLGIRLDSRGGRLDAGKFLFVVVPGQMDPAGKLAAQAVTAVQFCTGRGQSVRQILLGQKALCVGNINC